MIFENNRQGPSQFSVWLKTLERVAVLIASLFAIFPLVQFYSEAGDRRIDRASNFISAFSTCISLDAAAEKESMPPETNLPTWMSIPSLPDRSSSFTESEMIEAVEAISDFLREQIERECDYIYEANKAKFALPEYDAPEGLLEGFISTPPL